MIRPIILWPDDKLHEKSPLADYDDIVAGGYDDIVKDLFDTMYEAGGVGLSAIQIGVPLRLFVMEVKQYAYVFFNPIILSLDGKKEQMNEGCLSVPDHYEMIFRHPEIEVAFFDGKGKRQQVKFSDMEAQCVQHEAEHLDGIVMPDKLSQAARGRLLKKMQKTKAAGPVDRTMKLIK